MCVYKGVNYEIKNIKKNKILLLCFCIHFVKQNVQKYEIQFCTSCFTCQNGFWHQQNLDFRKKAKKLSFYKVKTKEPWLYFISISFLSSLKPRLKILKTGSLYDRKKFD